MQINGIYLNGISTPIMVQNPKSRQFTTQNNDNQDVFVKSNTQPGTIVSTEKSSIYKAFCVWFTRANSNYT